MKFLKDQIVADNCHRSPTIKVFYENRKYILYGLVTKKLHLELISLTLNRESKTLDIEACLKNQKKIDCRMHW